ncbi:uncharacterized protein T551_01858 [Pneumocystis jirovecii RU7]|uniref:Uncharacterized protein n=1 Tax=Pneumocystis jirovecii (strain RU7) TaxID=1408657 RepID=A0A0W4ZNH4_PNEJ7|nr:uncharacterized protein T551_01858 [Pneumocystis jirovecii RU7]KTW29914.1 hypothetical protein T551_01858 [Pneumocystis jirovecii RU7]
MTFLCKIIQIKVGGGNRSELKSRGERVVDKKQEQEERTSRSERELIASEVEVREKSDGQKQYKERKNQGGGGRGEGIKIEKGQGTGEEEGTGQPGRVTDSRWGINWEERGGRVGGSSLQEKPKKKGLEESSEWGFRMELRVRPGPQRGFKLQFKRRKNGVKKRQILIEIGGNGLKRGLDAGNGGLEEEGRRLDEEGQFEEFGGGSAMWSSRREGGQDHVTSREIHVIRLKFGWGNDKESCLRKEGVKKSCLTRGKRRKASFKEFLEEVQYEVLVGKVQCEVLVREVECRVVVGRSSGVAQSVVWAEAEKHVGGSSLKSWERETQYGIVVGRSKSRDPHVKSTRKCCLTRKRQEKLFHEGRIWGKETQCEIVVGRSISRDPHSEGVQSVAWVGKREWSLFKQRTTQKGEFSRMKEWERQFKEFESRDHHVTGRNLSGVKASQFNGINVEFGVEWFEMRLKVELSDFDELFSEVI